MKNRKGLIDPMMKSYFDYVNRFPVLTREQEIKIVERRDNGAREEAINQLIDHNQRLVMRYAFRFIQIGLKNGFSFGDLIGSGNLGLRRAAEKFDVNKKCRFATYALPWIFQSVSRVIQEISTTRIRVPVQHWEAYPKIHKAEENFISKNNRSPFPIELVDITGYKTHIVKSYFKYFRKYLSGEEEINGGNFVGGINRTEDKSVEMPSDKVAEYREVRNQLELALSEALNEKEEEIIRDRYGFGRKGKMTLEELGVRRSVTRSRIGQIEKRAIKKLQIYFNEKGIEKLEFNTRVYKSDPETIEKYAD